MSEEKAREILKKQGMTNAEIDEAIEGVKRGLKDIKEGRVKPWSQVKKELGIK